MPKAIPGFRLRDDQGYTYQFGYDANAIDYTIDFFHASELYNKESFVATSWYLTNITDKFGNVLYTLKYKRGYFSAQFFNVYGRSASYGSQSYVNKESFQSWTSNDFPGNLTGQLDSPVYLDSIIGGDIKVKFSSAADSRLRQDKLYPNLNFSKLEQATPGFSSTYEDYAGRTNQRQLGYRPFYYLESDDKDIYQYVYQYNADRNHKELINPVELTCGYALNYILIYNTYNPDYFIRINFDYDFSSRMHLTKLSIKEPKSDGYADSKSYDFSYNDYSRLPSDYLSRAIDHWGYYNGTEYTVPITNYTTFYKQREPHRSYNTLGMLTQIKYPTGGVSQIMYDTNTYTQKLNENRDAYIEENKDGGGVRVYSITEYEDESLSTIIKKKSFSYDDPKTYQSSGILFASPKYVWYDWRGTPAFGNAQAYLSTFRASSLIPHSNSFGPAIGYSYIREENLDGGYTIYHYSNIEPLQDLPYSVKFSDKGNFPNQHFTERGYLRGKLLDVTNYNSNNKKVDKISYTYRDCGNEQDSVITSDIGVVGSNYYCAWIGGIYTLRYATLKPATITHTIYNNASPNDSIVTTDSYTYSYNKNFSTVFNSTFNNKANTTLVTQHLQKRGNDSERTLYSYYGDSNYNKLAPNFHVLCPTGQTTIINNQRTEYTETKYQEITTPSNVKVPVPAATIKHYSSYSDTLYTYTDYTNTGLLSHCVSKNGDKISFGYDNSGNYLLWKAVGHNFYSHGKFPSSNVFIPGKLRDTFRMQLYNTQEMNFTLYSYDYLFGINSITLPDASMTTYKYKGGKLSSIIDNEGKEIQSFEYNYKNQ